MWSRTCSWTDLRNSICSSRVCRLFSASMWASVSLSKSYNQNNIIIFTIYTLAYFYIAPYGRVTSVTLGSRIGLTCPKSIHIRDAATSTSQWIAFLNHGASTPNNQKLSCRREAARLCLSLKHWNIAYGLLKIIANGTIRKLGCGFLFAFHSNCGRIFSRFDIIHERDRHSATQTGTT